MSVRDLESKVSKSLTLKRASPRFVILSGEKRRMRDNECQNSCDLSRRIAAKPPSQP